MHYKTRLAFTRIFSVAGVRAGAGLFCSTGFLFSSRAASALLNVPTNSISVEIAGMDVYDPIKDEVKNFSRDDIACWMVDDEYDGASFIVKQVFLYGGVNEFDKCVKPWKKQLRLKLMKKHGRACINMSPIPFPIKKVKDCCAGHQPVW